MSVDHRLTTYEGAKKAIDAQLEAAAAASTRTRDKGTPALSIEESVAKDLNAGQL